MGQAHASAAKAGVDALTRTLAVEWGPSQIRVNGLAPGPVEGTEGVRRLTTAESRKVILEQCPLGRLATIDEVARAALFLCSGAGSFITGVTLVIDGRPLAALGACVDVARLMERGQGHVRVNEYRRVWASLRTAITARWRRLSLPSRRAWAWFPDEWCRRV